MPDLFVSSLNNWDVAGSLVAGLGMRVILCRAVLCAVRKKKDGQLLLLLYLQTSTCHI